MDQFVSTVFLSNFDFGPITLKRPIPILNSYSTSQQEIDDEFEEEQADEESELEFMPPALLTSASSVSTLSSPSTLAIDIASLASPRPLVQLYPVHPLPPPPSTSTLVSACASLLDIQTRHLASNALMKELFQLLGSS